MWTLSPKTNQRYECPLKSSASAGKGAAINHSNQASDGDLYKYVSNRRERNGNMSVLGASLGEINGFVREKVSQTDILCDQSSVQADPSSTNTNQSDFGFDKINILSSIFPENTHNKASGSPHSTLWNRILAHFPQFVLSLAIMGVIRYVDRTHKRGNRQTGRLTSP